MLAILKHELRTYFYSITAYIFGAFLLVVIGIGAMLYNIQASVSNFEFVLRFGSMVFVVIVPILTMKTISEEKKQKTDQLLYSLPITTTEIIVGKYLALLIVFLVPICIIAGYPLIFSRFGDVSLLTAYGTMFAFFLMGMAFIAIGLFISSITANQGIAAGIGIAVILLNYFLVNISEQVSSTAIGSLLCICILNVGLYFLIRYITGNNIIAYIISGILFLVTIISFFIDQSKFEGLLPKVMKKISLFDRLDIFVNGVFDLTSIIYFLTVSVLFLFLAVQSLEKKRYN